MLSSQLVAAQLYEYREMINQSMTKSSLFYKLIQNNRTYSRDIKTFNDDLQKLIDDNPLLEVGIIKKAFNALYKHDLTLLIALFTLVPNLYKFYHDRLDFLCAKNQTFMTFIESESNLKESSSSSLMAITSAYDIERDRADSSLSPNKYLLPNKPKMKN